MVDKEGRLVEQTHFLGLFMSTSSISIKNDTMVHPLKHREEWENKYKTFEKNIGNFINDINPDIKYKALKAKVKLINQEIAEFDTYGKDVIEKINGTSNFLWGIPRSAWVLGGITLGSGLFEMGGTAITTFVTEPITNCTLILENKNYTPDNGTSTTDILKYIAFGAVCVVCIADRCVDIIDRIIYTKENSLSDLSKVIDQHTNKLRLYKDILMLFTTLVIADPKVHAEQEEFDETVEEALELYEKIPGHLKNEDTPSEIVSTAISKRPAEDKIKKTLVFLDENLPTELTTQYLDEKLQSTTTLEEEKGELKKIKKMKEEQLSELKQLTSDRFKTDKIKYVKTPKGRKIFLTDSSKGSTETKTDNILNEVHIDI